MRLILSRPIPICEMTAIAAWSALTRDLPDDEVRQMAKSEPTTVVLDDPLDRTGKLRAIGGSPSDAFNNALANAAISTLWLKNFGAEDRDRQIAAAVAALVGIAPQDELEGMLAGQLLAANAAAMECYRRAMLSEQTFEGRKENLTQANKLSRTYVTLLEALNRHRGKSGQQKVTVEHVHVHAGGQAVVGAVQAGGGVPHPIESQPHAQAVIPASHAAANAPLAPMRRADEGRQPVPVAGHAERALSHARRRVTRRTEG